MDERVLDRKIIEDFAVWLRAEEKSNVTIEKYIRDPLTPALVV